MCRDRLKRFVGSGLLWCAVFVGWGESCPVGVVDSSTEPLSALCEQLSTTPCESSELARQILIRSLCEGQGDTGLAALRRVLCRRAEQLSLMAPERLDELIPMTCAEVGLAAFAPCAGSPELWRWLFESDERMRRVAATLSAEDEMPEVTRILQSLYEHDPVGRDSFFNLIVALAVVWDTPRKRMHDQIGKGWLRPDKEICLYYDYFKQLYGASQAKVRYADLTLDSLVFVVDVPAPVSELKWAQKKVKGTRVGWGKNYDKIIYDVTRLVNGQYDWPHRKYSLQEILECHGICVDQAYYCVISARAHGIPCLYFHGKGRDGGHAWFGFLKKKNQWDFNVGRYSQQGYATGFTIHPQTDREMTDHELEFFCSRLLRAERSHDADMLVHLAELVRAVSKLDAARIAADRARTLDPLCQEAWGLACDLWVEIEALGEAIEVLDLQAECFKDFPDCVTQIRKRQASVLAQAGNAAAAGKILRREAAWVQSKRDDLQRELVLAQAEQLVAQGQAQQGLNAIGRVLWEQRDGGMKIAPLIKKYIEFAEKNNLRPESEALLKSLPK